MKKEIRNIKNISNLNDAVAYARYEVILCIIIVLVVMLVNMSPNIISTRDLNRYKELEYRYGEIEFVRRNIERDHIHDIDDITLGKYMIDGMLNNLGETATTYFSASEFEQFSEKLKGSNTGIGIGVTLESDGTYYIDYVAAGSPAERDGIVIGDVILSINGIELQGGNPFDIIPSKKGETVELKILRDGEELVVTTKVEKYKFETIRAEKIGSVGYIHLFEFRDNLHKKFSKELDKLIDSGITSLVIDVRNNPGGRLRECIEILSKLQGEAIALRSIYKDDEIVFKTKGKGIDIPIYLLINEYSASASEILAVNLKEHGKGILIGNTTYGKGTGQAIYKSKSGGALLLTVQENKSPKGNTINNVGVEPDIFVEMNPSDLYVYTGDIEKDIQLQKALKLANK